MELALLVYAISLIEPIKITAALAFSIPLLILFIGLTVDNDALVVFKYKSLNVLIGLLCVLCLTILVFIPNKKTAYMMVGAYAAQKVYDNPTTERLSNKVIQSIEGKLDFYIEEARKEATEQIKGQINGK